VPPEDAVRQAAAEPQGLVLISDMGDAVYAGGPGDSACILGQLWAQQVPVLSFVPIVDPSAVKEAFGRGLGPIELSLGGKTDPFSRPVAVSGRIAALSQGLKIVTDKGQTDLGRTALVEAGNLRVVLLENRSFTMIQPLIFTHLGLEMEMARIVVTKTGSNFQFFDRWRRKLIRADSQGVTQSDLKGLTWRNLPRPIFPLDNLDDWAAEPQIRE
jgi:microcystin degradation protein MlrC